MAGKRGSALKRIVGRLRRSDPDGDARAAEPEATEAASAQEDTDDARIWRYDLAAGTWEVVATVNDPDGESSGIIDASNWFGPGAWLLDVQSHGVFQKTEVVPNPDDPGVLPDLTKKREAGQLILMTIPGS